MANGGGDRGGIRVDISLAYCAWNEPAGCIVAGASDSVCVHDPFPGPPARGELAIYAGMVLDPRFFRAGCRRRARRPWSAMAVGTPADDVGMGERARRLFSWICIAGNFPAGRDVDLVPGEREPDRGNPAKNRGREASAESGGGRAAFRRGEPGESLWMETPRARLPLSVEPLLDGSH